MIRFGRLDRVSDADAARRPRCRLSSARRFREKGISPNESRSCFEHRHERGYDVVLLTAEEEGDRVIGFALAHYYPDLHYAYLDYIASDPDRRTLGIGGRAIRGGGNTSPQGCTRAVHGRAA